MPYAGTELEFIIFRDTYEEAWHKGFRDLVPANLYNVDYSLLGTARVEVTGTTPGTETFVGIAPLSDATAYLGGVERTVVDDVAPACVETTITPDNEASARLFTAYREPAKSPSTMASC